MYVDDKELMTKRELKLFLTDPGEFVRRAEKRISRLRGHAKVAEIRRVYYGMREATLATGYVLRHYL